MAFTKIYTIGFTKKSAEEFFESLRKHGIRLVVDVRLNNKSQLSGFSKKDDLAYFLDKILGAGYVHEPLLAPSKDVLKAYRTGMISWAEYEQKFLDLMQRRQIERKLPKSLLEQAIVLLCSEPTAERCHRRLVAEYLAKAWGDLDIVHL